MPPPISTSPRPWRRSLTRSRSGTHVDETSAKAKWHIPRAHYLESWGDARAVGGTLSVVQPLILPLFGGRTPRRGAGADGRAARIVPATTSCARPGSRSWARPSSTRKWNRVLHDGLLAGSELPEVVPALTAQPLAELARAIGGAAGRRGRRIAGGLEIVFLPSPSLHDGRFANDGWLQELPDPAHQAHLGQPRAREPEDRRDARSRERGRGPSRLRGPLARAARLDPPGHGGRRGRPHARLRPLARGRIGIGVGFDTFTVRTLQGTGLRQRGHASPGSARTYPLSATQEHGSMEGRPLVREST